MKKIAAYRIVTFLPVGKKFITPARFLEGINKAVPLKYGNYDLVAYLGQGHGTFRPLAGSNPTQGRRGKMASPKTIRVEFSVPRTAKALKTALSAVFETHPWEEPGIQVYPVHDVLAARKK